MLLVSTGLVILLVVCLYVGVPLIHGRCARLMLKRKAIKSKVLVLTFDDGPGNKLTPAILKILSENNVNATFFLLGRNIAGRENIVRQIAEQGHEICSHGYNHLHYWKVSPIKAIKDIKQGWRAIDTALGVEQQKCPFRPPYGKLNLLSLLYLVVKGVPVYYWSVVSGDTWAPDKRDSKQAAVSAQKAGGAVILAHDFDRTNDDVDKMVLDAISLSLLVAKEKGMKVMTLSELVRRNREI